MLRLGVLVSDINVFFDEDDLPYYLTNYVVEKQRDEKRGFVTSVVTAYPTVIYRENEVLHQMAIEPALSLLEHPRFNNAHEEYLGGLRDYKEGKFKECVAKCASSLESVMKIICVEKNWHKKPTSLDCHSPT